MSAPECGGDAPETRRLPLAPELPWYLGSLGQALGRQAKTGATKGDFVTRLSAVCMYSLGNSNQNAGTRTFQRVSLMPNRLNVVELHIWVPNGHLLAPGLYHYLPLHHALEPVRSSASAPRMRGALGNAVGMAEVVLCVSADFQRATGLQGEAAIRLASLEAGQVVENLALFGRALGWRPVVQGFDQDAGLGYSLGLNLNADGIAADVLLFDAAARLPASWRDAAATPPNVPTARSIEPIGPAISLPPPAAYSTNLYQLLHSRSWRPAGLGGPAGREPVPLRTLGTFLHGVCAPPTESDLDGVVPAPYLLVAPVRVYGLASGLYGYHVQQHQLFPLAAETDIVDLMVSLEAVLWHVLLVAPRASVSRTADGRIDRLLHLQAGALTQRMILMAAGQGLVCHMNVGDGSGAERPLLGVHGPDHLVLNHVLVGPKPNAQ